MSGTVRQFLDAFFEPTDAQKSFLVKVAWIENEELEHIWLADLDFAGERPRGVVANESSLPSLKFMQTVEFEPAQITDWMYIDDGFLVGFTTRVIRDWMTPEERKRYDATAPYKFRDVA